MLHRMLLKFKGDMEYFTLDTIVVANGSSQGSNETFVTKIYWTRFSQYPGIARVNYNAEFYIFGLI